MKRSNAANKAEDVKESETEEVIQVYVEHMGQSNPNLELTLLLG